jgi:auxin efflux carrier family protein
MHAISFNNTTSLPLLLAQALEATSILERLVVGDETASKAIEHARSYFLVCAIVGNCLAFAMGPGLLDTGHAPGKLEDDNTDAGYYQENGQHEIPDHDNANEQTSLLPNFMRRDINQVEERAYRWSRRRGGQTITLHAKCIRFCLCLLR